MAGLLWLCDKREVIEGVNELPGANSPPSAEDVTVGLCFFPARIASACIGAFHRTKRAEHATASRFWPDDGVAARALVEVQAGVRGNGFCSGMATDRTSNQ